MSTPDRATPDHETRGAALPLARVLVAVDDAPVSLRAARAALAVAAATHATVRAVTVVQDGVLLRALAHASTAPGGEQRVREAASAVLRHVRALANRAGVALETEVLDGDPGQEIVSDAHRWEPDLVVIGRCARTGTAHPALGHVAQHVIDLGDVPVLVVP